MKKTDYQKPTCEILVVRFEENIMSPGSGYSKSGNAGNTMNEDDDYSYSF